MSLSKKEISIAISAENHLLDLQQKLRNNDMTGGQAVERINRALIDLRVLLKR